MNMSERWCRLAADRRRGPPRFAGLELEGELETVGAVGLPYVIADQRASDAELAIGFEVGVLRVIHLGSDRLEARLVDEKVDMRRSVVMTSLCAQQGAGRAFGRHRITGGLHAFEVERAVGVGLEARAQIHVRLARVL